MALKIAKQRSALLDELIKTINVVLKKHRRSLLRDEVTFLKQSIVLLKEYKKTGLESEMNSQVIVIQVVGVLTRFFLFGSEDACIGDLL